MTKGPSMSLSERRRLRAQHTCQRDLSSLHCRACNRGVPFPPLVDEGATLEQLLDAMFPQRLNDD